MPWAPVAGYWWTGTSAKNVIATQSKMSAEKPVTKVGSFMKMRMRGNPPAGHARIISSGIRNAKEKFAFVNNLGAGERIPVQRRTRKNWFPLAGGTGV